MRTSRRAVFHGERPRLRLHGRPWSEPGLARARFAPSVRHCPSASQRELEIRPWPEPVLQGPPTTTPEALPTGRPRHPSRRLDRGCPARSRRSTGPAARGVAQVEIGPTKHGPRAGVFHGKHPLLGLQVRRAPNQPSARPGLALHQGPCPCPLQPPLVIRPLPELCRRGATDLPAHGFASGASLNSSPAAWTGPTRRKCFSISFGCGGTGGGAVRTVGRAVFYGEHPLPGRELGTSSTPAKRPNWARAAPGSLPVSFAAGADDRL